MDSMSSLKVYFSICHNHPWNSSTTLIVVDVFETLYNMYGWKWKSLFCLISEEKKSSLFYPVDYQRLFDTIDRLNRLADQRHWYHFGIYVGFNRKGLVPQKDVYEDQELERLFMTSFIPEVGRFITVQNMQRLYDKDKSLPQNQVLAAFLAFLLQILDSEGTFWFGYRKYLHLTLQKNVTFLLTMLGDTPFRCSGHEDVDNLLVEFELVAKASWNFIHSSIFASSKKKRKKKFDAGIHALLGKIDSLLNEVKLVEFPKTAHSTCSPLHSPFIVDSLLEDLEGLINGQFILAIVDIEDHIKTLIDELAVIQTIFKNIQTSQITYVNELKESMVQIRELSYEAEYLIKTYVMERLPTWYLNLRLPDIVQKVNINRRELQEIQKRCDIEDINIKFTFRRGVSHEELKDPEVVVESMVIGFKDNRTKILADLVGGSKGLNKIVIYGMPGIGKTTIAKKMYSDGSVCDHFDLRAWCVVSQTYDRNKTLNDILMSLGSKSGKDYILRLDGEGLGLEIYQSLFGRRYIIFMDDVWYSSMWDDLGKYFPDIGNGSRILLTSRNKDIAPPDSIFHTPRLLSESQCCDLLVKKVFDGEPCPPELVGIAKGIASKCHGLPLAVVVVAGIMANIRKEESTWKNVEANLNSYISDNQSKYTKILELSYEHLPDHLKPCFLYLGRFHEDDEIPMWKVIPMWISEGFVRTKEEKNLEQVAEEYYSDLINRSLLMIAKRKSDGGVKACNIHDLLRDMCLRKVVEEKSSKHINKTSKCKQHSHLVLHTAGSNPAQNCHSLSRYILSFGYDISKMPLLRVIDGLDLKSFSSLYEMERICNLVHLKYLSFSATKFPIGLCILVNLEYFQLYIASSVSVPANILKMVKLRHVCITTEAVFENSCDSSKTMNNLESLSYVLIRNGEDDEILRCSPRLRKLKCVCDGSLFPDFNTLTELESLAVKCTSPPKGELTGCCFPSTIKKLSFYGTSLPWEKMTIIGSLPNLHVLKLLDCAFVGDEWNMTYGEFKQLRFLRLEDLDLKQWITSSEHLPRLQSLVLESIIDLMEIPSDLGDIPTLERIQIRYCSNEIERSAIQIQEEQRDYGNEELRVIITNGKKLHREDIALVMSQAGVSRTRAVRALKNADEDIIDAIMKLTE